MKLAAALIGLSLLTLATGAARAETAPEFEADFRQLGGFTGAGFTADDHDLIPGDGLGDFLAAA